MQDAQVNNWKLFQYGDIRFSNHLSYLVMVNKVQKTLPQ